MIEEISLSIQTPLILSADIDITFPLTLFLLKYVFIMKTRHERKMYRETRIIGN